MNLSVDGLYEIIQKFHSSAQIPYTETQIFDFIEKSFSHLEQCHSQNFLNFLVEEYKTFSSCKDYFKRVKNLSLILKNSSQLSSIIVGYTSLTKLWIQSADTVPGINEFIDELFKTSRDTNQVPHVQTICSQCLLEIYNHYPDLIKIPYDTLIECCNLQVPTAFPELAIDMNGSTDQILDYYSKRWWYNSPFETTFVTSIFQPEYPLIPNDPILLHIFMTQNKVPRDTLLSLINTPLSSFGVSSVLLGFKDTFSFNGDSLFTPFDTKEQIASKSQLLPPLIESIETNSTLSDFVNHSPTSSIVSAVFEVASRFKPRDLFKFFRKYYEKTSNFDNHWVKLYETQNSKVQTMLRSYLLNYPKRESSIRIMLQNNIPTLSIINNITEDNSLILSEFINSTKNDSLESITAINKLKQFNNNNEKTIETSHKNESNDNTKTPNLSIENSMFNIVDKVITTNDRTKTMILLSIEINGNLNNKNSQVYAARFQLSNPNYFVNDGISVVSSIINGCQVQFEMEPKKSGPCKLRACCIYTNVHGETKFSYLNDIDVTFGELLSPLTNVNDFNNIWEKGIESRVTLQMKFNEFMRVINSTVLSNGCIKENEIMKVMAVTPDGAQIAMKAFAIGNNTAVHFKAPNIEMLELVDEYLRTFTNK
ncbi:hypothetical protein GPJ56_005699 [Histomonas meleagridis]|uniref:uncharacterized protein n=1 Tax=Histomonas meleagridis TaxID=135588 RepID=UPI003559DF38|nr:hypothetical protein GPJ56_005699 [Histomonas meleagridis]KAH0803366.1 hypothetical protein GO595_003710 [Histomonas meleagridis]